jgi:TP901 family phage tail tape measure protein
MNLFELVASITLDTSEYEDELDRVGGNTDSFSSKLKSGLATAAKVGAAAVGAATTAVVAFGTSSVETGMQFDTSMSQVAATMGTTTDQIQDLRDFALEMGSTTAFSATEAAEALNYMALAGYDADESMEALPNVLNLAAAGSMDLATASDMVTDAQSALGLSMEESAELVDKMAMASSKSNTSVEQLGDAILTVGGTAKNLAGGTTELSTALGILADNGIKGSEGGTALRNVILSLSAPTDTAAAAMESLGLEVFDAEGNMRPMNDVLNDLNSSMENMTAEEKQNIISTIFNKTDIAAVNALLSNSGERWDELSGYIDEAQGSAEAMANTQLDNLAGDITLFQSALEGAQIKISDGLSPTLREFVQFGTEGLTQVSEAFSEGGLSGAMDAFGQVLSDGLAMIIDMLPQMIDAGMQLLMALVEGIIDNLPQLVDAAIEIITTLADGLSDALPELLPAALEAVLEIVDGLISNVDKLIDAAIEIIIALADGLSDALPELLPAALEAVLEIVDGLISNVDKLIDAAIEIIIALADGLIESLPKLVEKAPEIILHLVEAIIKAVPQLAVAALEIVTTLALEIANLFFKLIEVGANLVKSVKDGFSQKVQDAKNWGKDLIQNFIDGLLAKWNSLKQTVSNVAGTIKDFLGFSEPEEGPLSNFHTYAPDMMELFAKGINDNSNLIEDAFNDSLDFGIKNVPFASSTYGAASAQTINAISSGSASGETTLKAYLVTPDGKNLATWLLNDLISVSKSNGTPIAAV